MGLLAGRVDGFLARDRDQGGAGALKIVIVKAHRLPQLGRRPEGRAMAQHPKGVVHRWTIALGVGQPWGEEGAEK